MQYFGENGIITKSKEARTATVHSQVYEAMQLESLDYFIEKTEGSYTGTLIEYLTKDESKPIIDGEGIINVANLLGRPLSLGNGTINTGDIYKIENKEETVAKVASTDEVKLASTTSTEYVVKYYDKDLNAEILGELFDSSSLQNHYGGLNVVPTNPDYFTYSFDTVSKTATLTGIKDEYMKKGYYQGTYPIAIVVRGRHDNRRCLTF